MTTPTIERLPPVSVEFLRVVQGVEAVRLRCEGCKTFRVASWEELGLPDDSPFPPSGVWMCSVCGGTDIAAAPEWPVEAERDGEVPSGVIVRTEPQDAVPEDRGAISPALRERLEAMMARLGRAEG